MKTLNLSDVTKEDSGIYTCVGKSHVIAQDENSIKVTVYYKPVGTSIKFSSFPAVINQFLTVTCVSCGLPDPTITILHNDTKVASGMTYNIFRVNWTHAGKYKCVANNYLGNESFSIFLRVNENKQEDCNSGTEWYIILVTLISGIIIGIILSYVVFRVRRENRKSKLSNPGPQTPRLDKTYQELDLKKMNKEDNYQSLRVNAARNDGVNDDESNYTELKKARDVENNYQSLT
ncbi:tyrosine-protein kinase receptor ver-3-like [Dendronephthya gigantea]|uniref:tyrosine-protein kinase receptor ver-3-like n=1 Tax=Dendronephthya gigantea TaxID=151771 RepID=UPI00106901A3|nr:tyrosine-protein kinase receptor ver-3-like [Dendronephthya gigantea]